MTNGCICCTLREDLLTELHTLSQTPGLEYILIESTGIGEPLPIAQTFYMDRLDQVARLDSLITVVDAFNFWKQYHSEGQRLDADGSTIVEPLAPLLVDQLEFTNIVLLNKADLADEEHLRELESFVHQLNPSARIYRTVKGELDPALLINTNLYGYETGMQAEDWELEWHKPSSEVEEYGFHSFVFRSQKQLQWDAFESFLDSPPYNWVARSKGIAFFKDHNPVLLSQAGGLCEIQELQPLDDTTEPEDEDQTTELVFIGQNMPQDDLLSLLQACISD